MKRPDGMEFDGNFKEGKAHGLGTLSWNAGDKGGGQLTYQGTFDGDERSGFGINTWADFTVARYEGEFKDNLMHGLGRLTGPKHVAGRSDESMDQYTGQVRDGRPHGVGRMCRGTTEYRGEYVDGKEQGVGRYQFTKDKIAQRYRGACVAGLYHGLGHSE